MIWGYHYFWKHPSDSIKWPFRSTEFIALGIAKGLHLSKFLKCACPPPTVGLSWNWKCPPLVFILSCKFLSRTLAHWNSKAIKTIYESLTREKEHHSNMGINNSLTMPITAVSPAQLVLPLWTNVFSKDHDGILTRTESASTATNSLQATPTSTGADSIHFWVPKAFNEFQQAFVTALSRNIFCSQASITCSPSGCSLTIRFWQQMPQMKKIRACQKWSTIGTRRLQIDVLKKKRMWIYFLITLNLNPLSVTSYLLEELGWLGHMVPQLPEFLPSILKGHLPSLKLTASLQLKMDGWNTIISFWDGIFLISGAKLLVVSGSGPLGFLAKKNLPNKHDELLLNCRGFCLPGLTRSRGATTNPQWKEIRCLHMVKDWRIGKGPKSFWLVKKQSWQWRFSW